MLDATAKKLVRLLDPKTSAELRAAAARVLREVGTKDAELTEALAAAIDDAEPAVRLEAIRSLGKLRVDASLPQLLARVRDGGREGEAAAQAAAQLGARGTRALQELMGQVAPGLRRWIAAALAAAGTPSASTAAIDVLLDSDPGVVDAAVRSLSGEIPALTTAQKKALADQLLDLLKPKKGQALSPASETAVVRLLAALGDPRGEAVLWARVARPQVPELRAAALQALGTLPPPKARDRFALLLTAAADRDFRVAAPALMILRGLAVTEKTLGDWLPLLDAPDPATRRFALEKFTGLDTPALAEALLRQLRHPDRGLRDEATARLGKTKTGRDVLARALLQAETPDDAWNLARAQAPFAVDYPPALRQKLFTRACDLLEEGDRRSDALLFLLREADARGLRDQLEERAVALRKKKKYEEALVYFRLLTRDPACAEPLRFEAAACALKVSAHDLAAEARAADPALAGFARLVHSHEVDPAERLKKEKWLAPEDLFYLGFHFAEGERAERDFAREVLQLVLKRAPRGKIAKDAKSKLRSAGLAS